MSHPVPIKKLIEQLQVLSDKIGEGTEVCVPDDNVLVSPVIAEMTVDGPAGLDAAGNLATEEICMVVILPVGHPSLVEKENDA